MKFKPLLSRDGAKEKEDKKENKKEDIGLTFQKLETQLVTLEKKYTTILSRELATARINKKKNVKNSANYSKIGVAYYSLNILATARDRIHEMKSENDLGAGINEMGALVGAINGLNGRMGKIDATSVAKGMKKLAGQSTGAGKDLVNTLSKLSGVNDKRADQTPIDALVSVDLIEKLISGELGVDSSIENEGGIAHSPDEMLDLFAELLGDQGDGGETVAPDVEALNMDIEDLINNLK